MTTSPLARRRGKRPAVMRSFRVSGKRLAFQAALLSAVAGSAILTKEFGRRPIPLASLQQTSLLSSNAWRPYPLGLPLQASIDDVDHLASDIPAAIREAERLTAPEPPAATPAAPAKPSLDPEVLKYAADPAIRWFNGRPVRPARHLTMEVTAYSPDWRSCGPFNDGITATLHSVDTNGAALVAADPKLLPYGSLLSIPGYDHERIVPVLDCGAAIKGHRLDVLYPTHDIARRWGRKSLRVTVWEYADGKPADEPRRLR